jgi:hypothetical protein
MRSDNLLRSSRAAVSLAATLTPERVRVLD